LLQKVTYEDIQPIIVTIEDAIKYESYLDGDLGHSDGHWAGNVAKAYEASEFKLTGQVRMGGQDHFYLETHATYAKPIDNGRQMEVVASCQNPAGAQSGVAQALGIKMNAVKDIVSNTLQNAVHGSWEN